MILSKLFQLYYLTFNFNTQPVQTKQAFFA